MEAWRLRRSEGGGRGHDLQSCGKANLRWALGLLRRQDKADNETVQAERLRENQNQHHADVQLGLLGTCTYARVTNNANRNSGCHTAKTARKAGSKVREAGEGRVLRDAIRKGRGNCHVNVEKTHEHERSAT